MNIFPTKEQAFKIIGDEAETLNRLTRRTDESENLVSQFTDKSFRGIINGNQFKIISSVIGSGAFCVMSGEITSGKGHVKVEIHKVFRILLSIILCFPLIGTIAFKMIDSSDFSMIMFIVAIGQVLVLRFIIIELVFRILSKQSLNRLRDVLDFEWVKT